MYVQINIPDNQLVPLERVTVIFTNNVYINGMYTNISNIKFYI